MDLLEGRVRVLYCTRRLVIVYGERVNQVEVFFLNLYIIYKFGIRFSIISIRVTKNFPDSSTEFDRNCD